MPEAIYKIKKISKPDLISNRPVSELKKIAHDIYTGRFFCSRQVEPSMLNSVFLVWALMDPLEKKHLIDSGLSLMYADMDHALPRSINGYPVFSEMRFLNRHDDLEVYGYYKDIQEKMGEYRGDFYYEK